MQKLATRIQTGRLLYPRAIGDDKLFECLVQLPLQVVVFGNKTAVLTLPPAAYLQFLSLQLRAVILGSSKGVIVLGGQLGVGCGLCFLAVNVIHALSSHCFFYHLPSTTSADKQVAFISYL